MRGGEEKEYERRWVREEEWKERKGEEQQLRSRMRGGT